MPPSPTNREKEISRFKTLLGELVKLEGGYSNHPADTPTKYGITQATWESFLKANLSTKPSTKGIKDITIEDAGEVYWYFYWTPNHLGLYPPPLDFIFFQGIVQFGAAGWRSVVRNSLPQEQKALAQDYSTLGKIWADKTPEEIKSFALSLLKYQIKKYLYIAEANPKKRVFLRGWINRVKKVAVFCGLSLKYQGIEY